MKKLCGVLLLSLVSTGNTDVIFNSSFEALFFVGGTSSDADVEVQLNHYPSITLNQSGGFTFPNPVEDDDDYTVQIITAPAGKVCLLNNASGTINQADVTDLEINCANRTTIYDVKQGTATGLVAIEDVQIVSCMTGIGLTAQTLPQDVDYQGDDFSGVYIFDNAVDCANMNQTPKVGDRVNLIGTVTDFFGQTQLFGSTFNVSSSGNPAPQPVMASTTELATVNEAPLEAVLVQVNNAVVTVEQLPPGLGDSSPTNEYQLDDELRVGDLLYLTTPYPVVNDQFQTLTGIMTYRNQLSKLLPRYSSDAFIADLLADNLVINEVDYDQDGSDDMEFIEVFNPTAQTISLTNKTMYLINGNGNSEYASIDLDAANELLSGQYLLIGSQAVLDTVDTDTLELVFDDPSNNIQNGPDGLLLIDRQTEVVEDALSYEGSITATIQALGGLVVDLVEGTATSESDSSTQAGALARIPSGNDSDDASTDWSFVASSPGAFNTDVSNDPTGLVINEIDYDQPGADDAEFIEIYNTSSQAISLQGVSLYLVNGSNDLPYEAYDLGAFHAEIGAGQYLVLNDPAVVVPMTALQIDLNASVQNGAPDGVLLFNENNSAAIDALSYEGAITMANINGTIVNLVEGTATGAIDTGDLALIRFPNGIDNNDAASEWQTSLNQTPGTANLE